MTRLDTGAAPEQSVSLSQRWNATIYEPFLALGERRGMAARRAALLSSASGRVLEIGAGTGLNLPHYPAALDELVLTEPEPGMVARLRRRVAAAGREARVVPAPAESLWFPDHSFDTVVSTMVLCTAPQPAEALGEIRRVLRPGGRLLLIEHVVATDARLARWQHRLRGPWESFAEGCRCDQDTLGLLRDSGLDPSPLRRDTWRGMPPIVHPLVVGALTVDPPAAPGSLR
jgi:SAM-dependent methyltransferase